MEELLKIQAELKAPKNQTNAFGGYNYRSCEDILEAVKPLLSKYGATLTITDELVPVGAGLVLQTPQGGEVIPPQVFVKATATIRTESAAESASAFARHPETRKGMDDSQITGSTSSYARKYALNGLFLIDDAKDADATNTHEKDVPRQQAQGRAQRGGHAPANRQGHAPRQQQQPGAQGQPPQNGAQVPQGQQQPPAPAKSPAQVMADYMAATFRVAIQDMEAAIGAPLDQFKPEDIALIKKTIPHLKGGMPFADAIVEAQN